MQSPDSPDVANLEKAKQIAQKIWGFFSGKPIPSSQLKNKVNQILNSNKFLQKQLSEDNLNQTFLNLRLKNNEQIVNYFTDFKAKFLSKLNWTSQWVVLPAINRVQPFIQRHCPFPVDYLFEVNQGCLREIKELQKSCSEEDIWKHIDKVIQKNNQLRLIWAEVFPKNQKPDPTLNLNLWTNPDRRAELITLTQIERLRALTELTEQLVERELERLLANAPDQRELETTIRLKWRAENLFGNSFPFIREESRQRITRRFHSELIDAETELARNLSQLNLESTETILKYSELVNRTKMNSQILFKKYMNLYFLRLNKGDWLVDTFITCHKAGLKRIQHVERAFLSDCFEGVKSQISQISKNVSRLNPLTRLSSDQLHSIYKKVAEATSQPKLKKQILLQINWECDRSNQLKPIRPSRSLADFLDFGLHVFSLLVKNHDDRLPLKTLYSRFFDVESLFRAVLTGVAPFTRNTHLVEMLYNCLMSREYVRRTRHSVMNFWKSPAPEDSVEGVRVTKIERRNINFRSTLFFSGYTSQDTARYYLPWKQAADFFFDGNLILGEWNSQTVSGLRATFLVDFLKLIPQLTLLSCKFVFKTGFNRVAPQLCKKTYQVSLIQNQQSLFRKAYDNALREGSHIHNLIKEDKCESSRVVQLCSFSLGTLVAYSFLKSVCSEHENHLTVGDVVLMGGCVTQKQIEELLPIMLAPGSFFKGKIIVVYSRQDYVLKYLFSLCFPELTPSGLSGFNHQAASLRLLKEGVVFEDIVLLNKSRHCPEKQMLNFLNQRIINVDVSSTVGGHLSYMNKLPSIFDTIDRII